MFDYNGEEISGSEWLSAEKQYLELEAEKEKLTVKMRECSICHRLVSLYYFDRHKKCICGNCGEHRQLYGKLYGEKEG